MEAAARVHYSLRGWLRAEGRLRRAWYCRCRGVARIWDRLSYNGVLMGTFDSVGAEVVRYWKRLVLPRENYNSSLVP
jgi:hypothetical protein